MPITVFTIVWAVLGLLSLIALYFFNSKPSIMAFITKREYLIFFLISALLGMREVYPAACIVFSFTLVVMVFQYPLYSHIAALNKKNHRQQHNYQHRKL